MVFLTAYSVLKAVIGYIDEDVQVITTYGLIDDCLTFTGTKTGAYGVNKESVSLIARECYGRGVLVVTLVSPLYQVVVDLFAQILGALYGDDS